MILVGTSGYNYPEWKGGFYPADLAASKMLPYYASKFCTVEINYTFYRMPTSKIVTGWAAQVPEDFKFTLKAPKRITHDKRLRAAEVADTLQTFVSVAGELGPQLAALLFQLPPNFKKDLVLLNEFLSLLPPKTTAAFEFRNASWLVRLRDEGYGDAEIARWTETANQLSATSTDVFVYFKHEDEGKGAAFGQQMLRNLGMSE